MAELLVHDNFKVRKEYVYGDLFFLSTFLIFLVREKQYICQLPYDLLDLEFKKFCYPKREIVKKLKKNENSKKKKRKYTYPERKFISNNHSSSVSIW